MKSTERKIYDYIVSAENILRCAFPHGETSAELILGSIEIAKMLQREELDGIVISGHPTPLTDNETK